MAKKTLDAKAESYLVVTTRDKGILSTQLSGSPRGQQLPPWVRTLDTFWKF